MYANTGGCGHAANQSASSKSLRSVIFLLLCFWVSQMNAEWRLQTIKSFGRQGPEPVSPQASLVEGDDGALYGVTDSGGSNSLGTVFKVNKAGTAFAVLHDFGSSPDDGQKPQGTLLKRRDGWLYGTTYFGGISNWGTIFKLNQDGSGYAILHHFTGGSDGLEPHQDLLEGSDGFLYGMTDVGGNANLGTIFKLSKDGTNFLVIHQFANGFAEPSSPTSGSIEGRDGLLYGTTSYGGNWRGGTVFRMNKDGSNFEVVHVFGTVANDGAGPITTLLQGDDGSLYGTTIDGGSDGVGVVYAVATDGSSYSILHSFRTNNVDGGLPWGRLIQGSDGLLYGTTRFGGERNIGTVYRHRLE